MIKIRVTRWIVPVAILSALLIASACRRQLDRAAAVPDARLSAAVDAIANAHLGVLQVPGLSVAMMRGQTLVLSKGYGLADREAGTAATPHTIYGIGSVTKQFTAAAVMRLVEQGRVRLDDPISTYLPEYRRSASTPTIRNLLIQSAGISEFNFFPEKETAESRAPLTLAALAALIAQKPPKFAPEDWWAYSNSNYALLAAMIERVTGKTYDVFLAEALYGPVGLKATASCHSLPHSPEHAVGYHLVNNSFARRVVGPNTARFYVGSGGLCSTVVDLASWMRALVDGVAVSPQSYQQMTTPLPVRGGFTPPYGFGVSLAPHVARPSVSHGGYLGGFSSMLAFFPEDDLIIAVAANGRYANVQHTLKAIARAALNLTAPAFRDVPITKEDLGRYVGIYDDGLFTIHLVERNGRLNLEIADLGPPRPLLYQGDGEFASAGTDEFRVRFLPSAQRAERFIFEWIELHTFGRRAQ